MARFGTGVTSPESPHSARSRSLSPPTRARTSGLSRILSPLLISKHLSSVDRKTDQQRNKSLSHLKSSDDTLQLRTRVAEYERKVPFLERTIRQLQKQLDASEENAERWKYTSTAGETKSGSGSPFQQHQEIVALKLRLEEQIALVEERDLAIENLVENLQSPPSQNTSVCSSFLDDIDTGQYHEMERLLKENSAYSQRLVEKEDDLSQFRRQKVEWDRERVALGKKIATLTLQQNSDKREVDILKRESTLLESQVSALQLQLAEHKGNDGSHRTTTGRSIPQPHDDDAATTNTTSTAHTLDSSRNLKRVMELQNELRKVVKERDTSRMELTDVRLERDSLHQELDQTRQSSNEEIKKLRTDLWKARVIAENMEDMIAELDHAKVSLRDSQRATEEKANSLKSNFRDMSQTIVRLQGEIRKRDAAISVFEATTENEKETERDLSVEDERQSLKTELDIALVDLERAALDNTELNKQLHGLQMTLQTKNDTILDLQQDLKSRTEKLINSRSEIVKKEHTIEALEVARSETVSRSSGHTDALRKQLMLKDEEIERLKQELRTQGSNREKSRLEISTLEGKIKELKGETTNLSRQVVRAQQTSENVCPREGMSQKEKLCDVEKDVNEIVLKKSEADLEVTQTTICEGTDQSDEDALGGRDYLRRSLVLTDTQIDSPVNIKERQNENLRRELFKIQENETKLKDTLEDLRIDLAEALSEKNLLERCKKENPQLRSDLAALKSAVDQMKQELADKEKLLEQKCLSIDKLHLEVHREKLARQKTKQELQEKEETIVETADVNRRLSLDLIAEKQHLDVAKIELKNKDCEISIVREQLDVTTKQNESLQQELSSQQAALRELDVTVQEKEIRLSEMKSSLVQCEMMQRDMSRLQTMQVRDSNIVGLEASTELVAESLGMSEIDVAKRTDENSQLHTTVKQGGGDVEKQTRSSRKGNEMIDQKCCDIDLTSFKKEMDLALQNARDECCELIEANDVLRILVQQGEAEAALLQSSLENADRKLSQNSRQLSDLAESKKLLSTTLEQASSDLTKMTSESALTRKALQQRNDENEVLAVELESRQQKLNEALGRSEETNRRLDVLISSLEETKDMLEKCAVEKESTKAKLLHCEDKLEKSKQQRECLVLTVKKKCAEIEQARKDRDRLITSKTEEIQILVNKLAIQKCELDSFRQALHDRNLRVDLLENSSTKVNNRFREPDIEVSSLIENEQRFSSELENTTLRLDIEDRQPTGEMKHLHQPIRSTLDRERPQKSRNEEQKKHVSSEAKSRNIQVPRGNLSLYTEQPMQTSNEDKTMKTGGDSNIVQLSKLLGDVEDKEKIIEALEETKNEAFDALRSLQCDLQAKESRIMKLDKTKLELCQKVDHLEEQVSFLSMENRNLSDELSLQLEERLRSWQMLAKPNEEDKTREKSLDAIRLLIEEGLHSVHRLEQWKAEADREALDFRRRYTSTFQEMKTMEETKVMYEREKSVLLHKLEDKESKATSPRELNYRACGDVPGLQQTTSTTLLNSSRVEREIKAFVDNVANRQKHLKDEDETAVSQDYLKQGLGVDVEQETLSITTKEDLNIFDEVNKNESVLAVLQDARTDSLDARATVEQNALSIAESSRLFDSQTKNHVEPCHELTVQGEFMERGEVISGLEARLQENEQVRDEIERPKVANEKCKTERLTILDENKLLKAEIETKMAELKELSDRSEYLKIDSLLQHENLKTLSEENQWLKKKIETLEAESADTQNRETTKSFQFLHVKSMEQVPLDMESSNLQDENARLNTENAKTTSRLKAKSNTASEMLHDLELKNDAIQQPEAELQTRKHTHLEMKELQDSNSKMFRELEEINLRLQHETTKCQNLRSSNEELESKVNELMTTIVDLNIVVSNQKEESFIGASIQSLKNELRDARKAGDEKAQAYERQICALTMTKDVTIDTIRKDLAAARSRSAEQIASLTNELSNVQEQNRQLEQQCNAESIRLRDQRIFALEHTLLAQEMTVDCLRVELEQLQLSTSSTAEQRRQEIEYLQQELMDNQSNLQKRVRECSGLKVQLEDCILRYDTDVAHLKREIENVSATKRTRDFCQSSLMSEVKSRLEHLKNTNVELKDQNTQLVARLELASERANSIGSEKEVMAEMEEECADLRKQVKELEALLENASGSISKSESTAKSRLSETCISTGTSPTKGVRNDSKGLGFGKKSKIPSVLFIGKSKAG
jgi:chromosome segregation ATPase